MGRSKISESRKARNISVSLKPLDLEKLQVLKKHYKLSNSSVIQKAIDLLHLDYTLDPTKEDL
jgi:hypothetical protein